MDTQQALQPDFALRAEPYRRELQVHCYRMLGSLQDAEDLVQETMLRAWQKQKALREPSALRAWLYRIATNACLDVLRQRPKRTLPTLSVPGWDTPEMPLDPILDPIWLEPLPDDWLAAPDEEPHTRYTRLESVSLAFLAALQILPARQRAVLLLSDVLDWHASEVAQLLGLTVAAVNSALHRARVTLGKHYNTNAMDTVHADDAVTQHLLSNYVVAWENSDIEGLVSLLANDAHLSMPPRPSWYIGPVAIGGMLQAVAFSNAPAGTWQLEPTRANGLPAFIVRQHAGEGAYQPFGIMVVQARGRHIQDVVIFMEPPLVKWFG